MLGTKKRFSFCYSYFIMLNFSVLDTAVMNVKD